MVYVCMWVWRQVKESLESDLVTRFLKEETKPVLIPAFK